MWLLVRGFDGYAGLAKVLVRSSVRSSDESCRALHVRLLCLVSQEDKKDFGPGLATLGA